MPNSPDAPLDATHPALSATRPIFVDNQEGNTLDTAIRGHLRALREERGMLWEVAVASGFFTLRGFNLLEPELRKVQSVKLLLGAEPRPEASRRKRLPDDPPPSEFVRAQIAAGLRELDAGIEQDRDLLPFSEETDAAVRRLLDALHSGRVQAKRFEEQVLHAKAYLFRTSDGGGIVGSSNLTAAGLRSNLD